MIEEMIELMFGGGLILMTLFFLFIWGFIAFKSGKFLARKVHIGLKYILPVPIFVLVCVAFHYRNPYAFNNLLGALIGSILAVFAKAEG